MPIALVNSVVTGPNLTKFLHDVARSSQLNFLKSELQYCNLFRNAEARNEGE